MAQYEVMENNKPGFQANIISPHTTPLSLEEDAIRFETLLHNIDYIVRNPDGQDNLDHYDLLLELYNALTQLPFEESYQLYQILVEQKIWFKDDKSDTFSMDVDRLPEILDTFFHDRAQWLEEQEVTDVLNSAEPLIENVNELPQVPDESPDTPLEITLPNAPINIDKLLMDMDIVKVPMREAFYFCGYYPVDNIMHEVNVNLPEHGELEHTPWDVSTETMPEIL